MKLDSTLLKIIETIKDEIKVKYKLEFSTQEIVEVIQTQIEVTKQGFAKGISVTWYRFCKFIYSERGIRKTETIKKLDRLLIDYEGASTEDINKRREEIIIESAEQKRRLISKGKEQDVGLKAEDVKRAEPVNKVNMVLFKQVNAKHSK
jgi:hypothetical protein